MENYESLNEGKRNWNKYIHVLTESPILERSIEQSTPATNKTPSSISTSSTPYDQLVDALFSYDQHLNSLIPILKYFESMFSKKMHAPENFLGVKEYLVMISVLEKFMKFSHDTKDFSHPSHDKYRKTLFDIASKYEEFIESKKGLNKDLDDNIEKIHIIINKLKQRLTNARIRST